MSTTTGPAGAAHGWHQLWQAVRWYVREVSGESAYQRYLERHGRDAPEEPPLDERTFWRQRSDGGDGVPPTRCC